MYRNFNIPNVPIGWQLCVLTWRGNMSRSPTWNVQGALWHQGVGAIPGPGVEIWSPLWKPQLAQIKIISPHPFLLNHHY